MAPSVSSGFPSCQIPDESDSGPDSKPVFKGKFEVFLFSSFSLFFPWGQRKISQGQAPWRRRGLPSTGEFPSGLSDPVSSLVISSEGERNKERKTTDPFSSLRLPLEGTERLCLSGEKREEQVPSLAERGGAGWTAAACWMWASSPVKQSFALDPQKQCQRASYLHVLSFKCLKTLLLSKSSLCRLCSLEMKLAGLCPRWSRGQAGVEERPGPGEKGAAGREPAEREAIQCPWALFLVPTTGLHSPQAPPLPSSLGEQEKLVSVWRQEIKGWIKKGGNIR